MNDFQPSRQKSDLADVVEMLLDKGVVINADIAVSIGDTQLLGIQVRAAIASFETAAKYGLEFPEGTDMRRVAEAVDDPELAEGERPKIPVDPTRGVNVSAEGDRAGTADSSEDDAEAGESESADGGSGLLGGDDRGTERLGARPEPDQPTEGGTDVLSDDPGEAEGSSEDEAEGEAEDR